MAVFPNILFSRLTFMNLSFASFNAPYNPVRFIYEKIASFDTVPYGPKNNDNYNQTSFI